MSQVNKFGAGVGVGVGVGSQIPPAQRYSVKPMAPVPLIIIGKVLAQT